MHRDRMMGPLGFHGLQGVGTSAEHGVLPCRLSYGVLFQLMQDWSVFHFLDC